MYKVELTAEEAVEHAKINWQPQGPEACDQNGKIIKALLTDIRDRIPAERWKVLSDSEYNNGSRKESVLDAFRRNGNHTASEISSHPHFLPYVRYLLSGPDLPETFVSAFDEKVRELAGLGQITSSDLDPLMREVRRLVRLHGTTDEEQVFRLVLEYAPETMNMGYAAPLRKAAMDAKRRRA